MTALELYEATRGVWRVGATRNKATYALAVYRGIVREVYTLHHWYPAGSTPYATRSRDDVDVPGRWEFEGVVAPEILRHKYMGKSVAAYFAAIIDSELPKPDNVCHVLRSRPTGASLSHDCCGE